MNPIETIKSAPRNGASALNDSLILMDSLGCAGLVVAPGDPTPSMLKAGAAVGGITPQLAEHVYHAMIQAED